MSDPSIPAEYSVTAECRNQLAHEIALAGGNEVFFFGSVDAEGRLVEVEVVARGHAGAVNVFLERAGDHHVLIHNHPGGDLTPSGADMGIAAEAGARRLGFFIIDNAAARIYRVVEPFPAEKDTLLDLDEIASIFSAGGLLDRGIPAFEDREGQRDLAVACARSLNQGQIAAYEAGTGIGKSFAYLVPSILWAIRNRSKVVISTRTIHLGEQLITQDLPTLARVLPDEFRYALIKGRSNYACRRKTGLVRAAPELFNDAEDADGADDEESQSPDERQGWITEILARLAVSKDGTRSDLPHEPPPDVWSDFASTSDQSLKARCPHYRDCFYYSARRRAFGAHIIVVNHHLLFADLAVRRGSGDFEGDLVIPGYGRVVFDEAHSLEEIAATHLGREVSRRGVAQSLGRLLSPPRKKRGRERGRLPWLVKELREVHRGTSLEHLELELLPRVREVRRRAEEIFSTLEMRVTEQFEEGGGAFGDDGGGGLGNAMARLGDGPGRLPIDVVDAPLVSLRTALDRLKGTIRKTALLLEGEPFEPKDRFEGALVELRSAQRAVDDPIAAIDFILSAEGPILPWVELRGGRYGNLSFKAAPLHIAEILSKDLYPPLQSVVMTSATLTVGDKWSFLSDRLGWDRIEAGRFDSAVFPSPFDYEKQVLLGLPEDLPSPGSRSFAPAFSEMLLEALNAARGRAFVLFTSHATLRDVAKRIEPRLRDLGFPLLVQGTEPRTELLSRFRKAGNAVLLGNQSFWEGVDVPGAALSLVVVARLPFRMPNHPLERGRAEEVEARGKSAFAHLALPQAVLSLKQGFGRLIRTQTDRGAVLIADSRVLQKSYGKRFLNSLPSCERAQGPWKRVRARLEGFFSVEEETSSEKSVSALAPRSPDDVAEEGEVARSEP